MWSKRAKYASALGLAMAPFGLPLLGGGTPPQFGDPLPGLSSDLLSRFQAGKAAFLDVEDPSDGLGPVFNNSSCASCHSQAATGGGSDTLETRFGTLTGGFFDPLSQYGGSLIQTQGIGLFGNTDFVGETVPNQATIKAGRRTTPLFGVGLVDSVPDNTLQQIAAFEAANLPATAGRANVVTDIASGQQRVGRFGWKCQNATLATFSGDAYVNEMGITTPMFPDENCPQGNCAELVDNPAPVPNDATNDTLVQFTDFMTLLAPPPALSLSKDAKAGGVLFVQIGCANCHLPVLQTGPNSVPALNNVTFFPFSDFLLHDMGSLNDQIAQNPAAGNEMRTAPLWGCRVLTSFLHDGRAKTLQDAILAHDGQGKSAKNGFVKLSTTQKNQLLAFLKSL